MKLAIIVLASAFVLSTTFALADSRYKYRSGTRTYSAGQSTYYGQYRGNYGQYRRSYGQYYGNPTYGGSSNNRGGLVGGADPGTYRP